MKIKQGTPKLTFRIKVVRFEMRLKLNKLINSLNNEHSFGFSVGWVGSEGNVNLSVHSALASVITLN